ncbi:SOS response-associated peptidase [Cytobacillus firmus]|nr:SOS response-associated peptidase [Cytobacillus firmus]
MCGRYTLTLSLEELFVRYGVNPSSPLDHQPRYNISPSQLVMTIINDGQSNRIGKLRWGLIPSWAKNHKNSIINVRAETMLQKFKVPTLRKRCLVPANSFFEWMTTVEGKQPMRIMLKSESVFSFAGIYDTWTTPDGQKTSGLAIVTTEPNPIVAEIHNRMPLILKPEDEVTWLNRNLQDPEVILSLVKPYDPKEMKAYPVSTIVGNVKNDSPDCIKELV